MLNQAMLLLITVCPLCTIIMPRNLRAECGGPYAVPCIFFGPRTEHLSTPSLSHYTDAQPLQAHDPAQTNFVVLPWVPRYQVHHRYYPCTDPFFSERPNHDHGAGNAGELPTARIKLVIDDGDGDSRDKKQSESDR